MWRALGIRRRGVVCWGARSIDDYARQTWCLLPHEENVAIDSDSREAEKAHSKVVLGESDGLGVNARAKKKKRSERVRVRQKGL